MNREGDPGRGGGVVRTLGILFLITLIPFFLAFAILVGYLWLGWW